MNTRLLFPLAFIFCISGLSPNLMAQRTLSEGDRFLVDEWRLKNNKNNLSNIPQGTPMLGDLPMVLFEYNGGLLNTNLINQANPDLRRPVPRLTYRLKLPNLSAYIDTLFIMVAINGPGNAQAVNSLIVGNTGTNLEYFLDYNNNFNFTDDGGAFAFPSSAPVDRVSTNNTKVKNKGKRYTSTIHWKLVSIEPFGSELPYRFVLYDLRVAKDFLASAGMTVFNNPYRPEQLVTDREREEAPAEKKTIVKPLNNGFRVNAYTDFAFGSGEQSFGFDTPDGETREYAASIDALTQLSFSASVSFLNFSIGGTFGLEGNQIGQTERYTYSDRFTSGRFTEYNTGDWPRRRQLYGGFVSYDIPLFRKAYLTPVYARYFYRYARDSPPFLEDNANLKFVDINQDVNTAFQDRSSIQYGLGFKYVMGKRFLLHFSARWVVNRFSINEFFIREPFLPNSLRTSYNTFNYGLGFQYILFGG
jgi:hypothetical protein